ncbi:MAG: hypothetical protein JXQ75_22690 [Phycisphaerae bacterium]|nr:hypothetical protein [Phycisphaerae bacterium]
MDAAGSKWWTPQTTCFLLLWVALLWLAPAKMLGDPGTLWHTVVGEQMLQTRELVRSDPFSFTCHGQPWIAQQWLGEIGMALLYRLAGLDGLVLAAVTLLAATYAFLTGRFSRVGLPWPACAVLVLLVVGASSYHFLPRPHIVTIALMAWMFAQLADVEAGRRNASRLLLLPLLYVLWANIHGGALGGIATSSCVLLAWLVWHHLPWARARGWKPVAPPVIIGVAASLSFVAVLANPYGPSLPRVWISLMHSEVLPKLIVEHAPMQVLSTEGAMILALAGIYLGLLATTWRRHPRVTWLMPLVWLVLTFTRIRHGPLFAVTAAVAIADMLPHSPFVTRFARPSSPPLNTGARRPGTRLRPATIPIAVFILALTLQANAIACPVIGAGWSQLDASRWPIEATNVLRQYVSRQEAGLERETKRTPEDACGTQDPCGTAVSAVLTQNPCGTAVSAVSTQGPCGTAVSAVLTRARRPCHECFRKHVKVFNDLGLGGYLIFASPQVQIYIDDRCELYRDDGLLQYSSFLRTPESIDAFAAYEDIGLALTRSRSRFDEHFAASPAWTTLYRDATASLYTRVEQPARGTP